MTVEEVKKALRECRSPGKCDACPLKNNNDCMTLLKWDALNAIEELEERIGIVQESMEALEKRCKALEALERRNEPVEPISGQDPFGTFLVCGNCGEKLENLLEAESINGLPIKWQYCRKCGQAVKWDG